ncbi:lysophospholipid acyltransferase family protein [Nereida sp. MMG025]|uniref:lysophospholipid acyltransferase family protein n=1 Tax=Nereida sp. MMG025 TaxID=2909981 RepID=UPI001F37BE21|nr:lauroyl acyltransferase [Nereida sp. MMG025]MCF6443396.1 lauroyl acyltransferase [Nereida sp. MMG025]
MATSTPQHRGTLSEWLIDRVLRGLIGGLRLIPFKQRVRLMGWIVSGGIARVAGYRKRAERNIALVYPDMSAARRRSLAKAACNNAGRTIIENYSGNDLERHITGAQIEGEGLAALQAAQAEGRPVLLMTGHFGNHEVPRILLHKQGFNIGGLYRPMRNPFFNEHYVKTMTDVSGPVFEQGPRGTRGFVKHLRAGGALVLLFDIFDYEGAELQFMGQPTLTATTAGELKQKFDAVVIPFFGIRQADGHSFRVVLERPVDGDTPEQVMQALSHRLEARVQDDPAQWFWIHRRWKNII